VHRGHGETQFGRDGGEARVAAAADQLLAGEQLPPHDLGVIHTLKVTSFQLWL
jgi:hypothetical protein